MKNEQEYAPGQRKEARLRAYTEASANLPVSPITQVEPSDNENKLVKAINEAVSTFQSLRIENILHEAGCKPPCKCDCRAIVSVFRRYRRKPERHVVRLPRSE